MASATTSHDHVSRHKHHRSPADGESSESCKRHKHTHRHHRHSRRHHYSHRSKKHEEETQVGDEKVTASSSYPATLDARVGLLRNSLHPDYDMEEGEIVEEDAFSGAVDASAIWHESKEKNLESQKDASLDFLTDSAVAAGDGKSGSSGIDEKSGYKLETYSVIDRTDRKMDQLVCDGSKVLSSASGGRHANSFILHEYHNEEDKMHATHSACERAEEKFKTISYQGDSYTRSRSRSHDYAREGSQSHSDQQDMDFSRRKWQYERDGRFYVDSHKGAKVVDSERRERGSRGHQHGSSDIFMDGRREPSTDPSRYAGKHVTHHDFELQEKSWEMDRVDRRLKERDRSREREMVRDRREKERERSRRDVDVHERSRYRDTDRGRRREDERHKSRDGGSDIDRKREHEMDRRRDREMERDSWREGERERERSRDRYRERDRKRDWEKDWFRERDIGRDGKGSEFEADPVSRHSRHDGADYDKDISRKVSTSKIKNSKQDFWDEANNVRKRDDDEQEDYQEKVLLQLAEQEEDDLVKIKEESRRRRQAILEKYKHQQLQPQVKPFSLEVSKGVEHSKHLFQEISTSSIVAENDENGHTNVFGPSFSVGKSPLANGTSAAPSSGAGGLGEGSPKSERQQDMFCDIFGESPAGARKSYNENGVAIERAGLHDNWDDDEGYYNYQFGEKLDSRYEITATHGKGVFSTVVCSKDLKAGIGDPEEVAIKIIRNNETMFKAGQSELGILKKLAGADPEDKRHCVRFISSFKYRNHLCLVFESLHMNLREVLKKFGRNIGLKLTAVRAYAKQLFIALKHLRNCGVLHCDIKPDNMLVNEAKNVLKLCDFGNAMYAGKNEITPYLVSRFYRAPEIILGLPYDHPLDMWSVGCCLYELYSGKVLFPGSTNNDMLRLHMELKGPFPKKMLRKGGFTDQHFDHDLIFHATEEDPVTKKSIKRMLLNVKPKDIGTIITGSPGEDPKMLTNFKDLLDKIFVLDPEKRMAVSQALAHPFITGK